MSEEAADALRLWLESELTRQLRLGGPGYDANESELRVEVASSKILFIAILRKLGGKIELTPSELMSRPDDFKVSRTHDYERNIITYRLTNERSALLTEERSDEPC